MNTLANFGWLLIATAGFAPAADNKVAQDLLNQPGSTVDVIVQYTTAPTAYHHRKVLNRGGVLKGDLGGVIRGAAYSVPASAIAELAKDPDVV